MTEETQTNSVTPQDIKAQALLEEVMSLTNRLAEARAQITIISMEKAALEEQLRDSLDTVGDD